MSSANVRTVRRAVARESAFGIASVKPAKIGASPLTGLTYTLAFLFADGNKAPRLRA